MEVTFPEPAGHLGVFEFHAHIPRGNVYSLLSSLGSVKRGMDLVSSCVLDPRYSVLDYFFDVENSCERSVLEGVYRGGFLISEVKYPQAIFEKINLELEILCLMHYPPKLYIQASFALYGDFVPTSIDAKTP